MTHANGKRLLEDARLLFEWDRFATALALAVLAQEEFAKAFVLQLVADDVLPWLPEVRRSLARHQCKHLLAIVMEWLPPYDWENASVLLQRDREQHERWMAWAGRRSDRYKQGNFEPAPDDPEPVKPDVPFPADVATALNIYRHEEIERFRSGQVWTDEDWSKGKARQIADGALDRRKQAAFYVHIGRTGEVGLHPELISREEAAEAIARAERLRDGPSAFSDEYRKLKEVLPLIFENLKLRDP
jgi:AbiV family abortive infection protein